MLTRRELIRNGSVAVAVATGFVPELRQAVARTSRIRRNANQMDPGDPDLVALRDFVEIMRARPATHPAGWRAFANVHGDETGFKLCQHQNWFFLPWHRAYLDMFERAVAAVTHHSSFAIPYWDWSARRTYPVAFSDRLYRGKANALFSPGFGDAPATATRTPGPNLPESAVGAASLGGVLAESNFELFASGRPLNTVTTPQTPQRDTDPAWLTRQGVAGKLEATPHNLVHSLTGSMMGTPLSARDPLFLAHHCNVDRLWLRWNASGKPNPSEPFWSNMVFRNHFINPDGTRYSRSVTDVLNTMVLGYTYDDARYPMRAVHAPSRDSRVQALLSGEPSVDGLRRLNARVPHNQQKSGPGQASSTRIDLPAGTQQFASGSVIAVIRELHASAGVIGVRIFLGLDGMATSPSDEDPHFVASIGFAGGVHVHHGQHGRLPSFAVDLTATLRELARRGLLRSDVISLQLVPLFADGARPDPAAIVMPAAVDIGIL